MRITINRRTATAMSVDKGASLQDRPERKKERKIGSSEERKRWIDSRNPQSPCGRRRAVDRVWKRGEKGETDPEDLN